MSRFIQAKLNGKAIARDCIQCDAIKFLFHLRGLLRAFFQRQLTQ